MADNYIILGFGVVVILLGVFGDSVSFGPRVTPIWHPMPKRLRIALVTYGVLVIILVVSRLGRG